MLSYDLQDTMLSYSFQSTTQCICHTSIQVMSAYKRLLQTASSTFRGQRCVHTEVKPVYTDCASNKRYVICTKGKYMYIYGSDYHEFLL